MAAWASSPAACSRGARRRRDGVYVTSGLSSPILTARDVRHAFGQRQALKGVSLDVRPGEIYALLGPNGAGKTTLVRAICGRLKPSAGEVRIAGRDPYSDGEARAALGLAPQALALYPQLTVAVNQHTYAAHAGLKGRAVAAAVRRAMAVTRTDERSASLVRVLSGGFQRRVNIAAAILAEPRLLVLDEPTVGVDLPAREAVSAVLRRASGLGRRYSAGHPRPRAGRRPRRSGGLPARRREGAGG